jgi:exodeoxyribonuclease VII small subunit
MKFEECMKRIEEIVADLEKGDLPLEESLDRFEEAVGLARECYRKLDQAQKRISKLVKTDEGEFTLEPLEDSGDHEAG